MEYQQASRRQTIFKRFTLQSLTIHTVYPGVCHQVITGKGSFPFTARINLQVRWKYSHPFIMLQNYFNKSFIVFLGSSIIYRQELWCQQYIRSQQICKRILQNREWASSLKFGNTAIRGQIQSWMLTHLECTRPYNTL